MLPEQRLLDKPATVTAAVATDGANKTKVTLTVLRANGGPAPYATFILYLSDSSVGAGLTATTASGAVANDGTSGADLGVITTKKALHVQANAAGVYALSITDTAKTAFKVVVMMEGIPFVVKTLAAGNYA